MSTILQWQPPGFFFTCFVDDQHLVIHVYI